jgi:hypothetical protein
MKCILHHLLRFRGIQQVKQFFKNNVVQGYLYIISDYKLLCYWIHFICIKTFLRTKGNVRIVKIINSTIKHNWGLGVGESADEEVFRTGLAPNFGEIMYVQLKKK